MTFAENERRGSLATVERLPAQIQSVSILRKGRLGKIWVSFAENERRGSLATVERLPAQIQSVSILGKGRGGREDLDEFC